MRALSIGPITVLISVWPVLKSLPRDRNVVLGRELAQRGDVDGEVRGAVGERHALLQRGVGVQHRRGDGRVVGVDRRFEGVEVMCAGPGSMKISVDAAPDHHDAVDLLLLAEAVDVLADRFQHGALVDRCSSRCRRRCA